MRKKATLYLPKDGKDKWTLIMEGNTDVSEDIIEGQPIVMSTATFEDGFMVSGGVYKSEVPKEFNIKFFNVYTPDGDIVPDLIDPSDHEDFRHINYIFYLNNSEEGDEYVLEIKEREKEWVFGED